MTNEYAVMSLYCRGVIYMYPIFSTFDERLFGGFPPFYPPPGQGPTSGPPTSPPPYFVPQQAQTFAVEPGSIVKSHMLLSCFQMKVS
jgi:hypothetical protein